MITPSIGDYVILLRECGRLLIPGTVITESSMHEDNQFTPSLFGIANSMPLTLI